MTEFNYDTMFLCTSDDRDNLDTITESLTRQMNDDDDDDDNIMVMRKARSGAAAPASTAVVPEGAANHLHTALDTEAMLRSKDSKSLLVSQESGHSTFETSRTLDQVDSKSLLSAYSRFSQPLSSSEPPTPGVMSVTEPSATSPPAPVSANPVAGYDQPPAGTGQRTLPSYNPQEDCPPPYEWVGERSKHAQMPVAQQMPLANPQVARASAGVQSIVQMPGGVYSMGTQIVPSSLLSVSMQKRPAVVPQQQQTALSGAFTPAVGLNQMVQSFAAPPSPMATSAPGATQRLQATPSLASGTSAPPPGYVQFLTPVQNVNGSTGCQMVMVPTQQISQVGSVQSPIGQDLRDFSQQQQQQQVMQYVWKAPPQQLQPQQLAQPQQFVTQQYSNISRPPQGYAIVQPGGQQSCMMAISTNQLQQVQPQAYIQQQLQPNSTRQVFITNQHPQQQLFATPVMPTTLPMGCRFN
ncbi:uncharacterized protein TEOVI_000822700 [Trypanosoma equiperdum]|uniref:Uncharacterized protein n=1 Tax=Trypanosoma equiperdum TaxID=5694 RepID=A0A1G4I6P1_TRYEQ|nr:hypothetical protein, conserved [Trypanosoma equiperdum]